MMGVIVLGDDKLVAGLLRFRSQTDLENAYHDTGRYVAALARTMAPVESGRLAGSVRYKTLTQKTVIQAGTHGFPYAPLVHYGTYPPGSHAQPFLTNAFAVANSNIPIVFDKEMAKTMKQTGV